MALSFPCSILPLNCIQRLQYSAELIKKSLSSVLPKFYTDSTEKKLNTHQIKDFTKSAWKDWDSLHQEFLNTLLEDFPELKKSCEKFKSMNLENLSMPEEFLKNPDQWLERLCRYLPKESQEDIEVTSSASQSRSMRIIATFFPNLAHVFIRAFDLFNLDRPPETLYEYGVLVTLYINFFTIPTYIIYALNGMIGNPLIVAAVAAVFLTTALGAIYTYLRYLNKCPSQVSYCINQPIANQIIASEDKYKEVLAHFDQICNVALVGEPGTGKTAFMNSLCERFPRFKVFKFDNKALSGGGGAMLKVVDRIEMTLRDIAGYEKEVILCYDELADTLKEDKTMETLIKQGIKTRFVSTMTQNQWDSLSIELKQRFKPIFFKPDDHALTEAILTERAREGSIEITDNVLQVLIKTTNKDKSKYAQPRKAVEAFAAIQGKISQFNIESYKTAELKEKHKQLAYLKGKTFESNSPVFTDKSEAFFGELEKLESEIQPLQAETDKQKVLARKIKTYLRYLKLYREKHIALARIFKQKGGFGETEKAQFQFTNFFAIPKIKELINQFEASLRPDVYVHLSEVSVNNYFKNS